MILAIVGSRNISIDISKYITERPDRIVSGGANGIDSMAAQYAKENDIPLTEYLPDYNKYGRGAPIKRNRQIIEASDKVIAFWDGKSKGTQNSIELAKKLGKETKVFIVCDSVIVHTYHYKQVSLFE